jgi:hypothetical protein
MKKFMIRMDENLHSEVKKRARVEAMTMELFIKSAIHHEAIVFGNTYANFQVAGQHFRLRTPSGV